ncbi:50S ribosomal protein L32 [Candidatus Sulcia muelleri]|uniref:Large ribosomal subunit protein bL32 n=1 Tax=Candidatus Karelsulcia muelleri TaxID=336810 RepID=A0A3A1ML57_9FLAO|nr:50S ribosomal protein L32 [Candidatus Karelsulcia muelleri]
MAHPKRKQSKSRKNKRRTYYTIYSPKLGIDIKTKQFHLYHRAHWYEKNLFYKGKLLFHKNKYIFFLSKSLIINYKYFNLFKYLLINKYDFL